MNNQGNDIGERNYWSKLITCKLTTDTQWIHGVYNAMVTTATSQTDEVPIFGIYYIAIAAELMPANWIEEWGHRPAGRARWLTSVFVFGLGVCVRERVCKFGVQMKFAGESLCAFCSRCRRRITLGKQAGLMQATTATGRYPLSVHYRSNRKVLNCIEGERRNTFIELWGEVFR